MPGAYFYEVPGRTERLIGISQNFREAGYLPYITAPIAHAILALMTYPDGSHLETIAGQLNLDKESTRALLEWLVHSGLVLRGYGDIFALSVVRPTPQFYANLALIKLGVKHPEYFMQHYSPEHIIEQAARLEKRAESIKAMDSYFKKVMENSTSPLVSDAGVSAVE